jgi:hypothetical protein
MRVIKDILTAAPAVEKREHVRALRVAADRVETADQAKTRAKAKLLSFAASAPQPIGRAIIDNIYLPTAPKRLLSNLVRAFR